MLNRGTVLLLVSAIALGGGVLLFENRQGTQSADDDSIELAGSADEAQGDPLFPFAEEDIESFSITRTVESSDEETGSEDLDSSEEGGTDASPEADVPEAETSDEDTADANISEAAATEDDSNDADESAQALTQELTFTKQESDGSWQMVGEDGEVEEGAIAFLLSQLTTTADQSISVEADTLEDFGLAKPIATVSITANEKDYLFHLGGPDFSGGKRYVQTIDTESASEESATPAAETEPETVRIHLIPGSILNAVNRPMSEWFVAVDSERDGSQESSSVSEPERPTATDSETDPDETESETTSEE